MSKNDSVTRDITPFLESVSALFAEQSRKGLNSAEKFRFLREQLITFMELCSTQSITRARAGHIFVLPNGVRPDTKLERPPTWMRIGADDREALEKTRKAKSLITSLRVILKQQGRAEKKRTWAALNTTFSDSDEDPEPELKKRKRYGAVGDDEYEPPQPKKTKVEKPILGVQPQPTASRKIKARRTPSGWSTSPSLTQKDSTEKRQGTLDFKVTKNANKRKEFAKPPSSPSFSNSNQHVLEKKEEQQQLCQDLEYEGQKPTANRDTVISDKISPGTKEHHGDSALERSVIDFDDTDIDTDSEDECVTHESIQPTTPMAVDTPDSPGFWPSAPKTTKSTSASILHEHALPLRQKGKEVEPPLERLRASLEIYETQIAHIPSEAWKGYNKRLETLCRRADFPSLPLFDRFCKFREIIYREEEDAAAQTDDWERLRKAAKLCGFLTEVTASPGGDSRTLVRRQVSVNLRDINWLQKLYSSKDHLWT